MSVQSSLGDLLYRSQTSFILPACEALEMESVGQVDQAGRIAVMSDDWMVTF